MALTHDQLEEFKRSFEAQFTQFLADRAENIGDRGDWRLHGVFNRSTDTKRSVEIYIARPGNNKKLSFTMRNVPDAMEADDLEALKERARAFSKESGLVAHTRTYVSSKALCAGNERAWRDYVLRRGPSHAKRAEKLLESGPPLILDPEDVVSDAVLRLLGVLNKNREHLHKPYDFITTAMYNATIDHRRGNTLFHEADSRIAKQASDEVEVPVQEVKEQLPDIIALARENMTDRQNRILDVIVRNNEEGNDALKLTDVAKETRIPIRTLFRDIGAIRNAVIQAAHEMGPDYEEAAALIAAISNSPGVHAKPARS